MTVSTSTARVVYAGNGSTTAFPFAFRIDRASELAVTFTDSDGTDYPLSPAVYDASGFGSDGGGTVTYSRNGSPIASGTRLTLCRDLPLTQPTSLSNQGALWPAAIEGALDRLTFLAQKIQDLASRALVQPASDSTALVPLPGETARANSVLGFDGAGRPYAATFASNLVGVASWLANNFLAAATSAANACAAIGAAQLGAINAFTNANSFTGGSIAVPTKSPGTASTDAASTAFVQAAIAQRTAVADADASPGESARVVAFTNLSAPRSVLLPAAASVAAGRPLWIVDASGSASAARAISLVPNGADTVAGSNTAQLAITVPRGVCVVASNGATGWDVLRFDVVLEAFASADTSLNNTATFIDAAGASLALGGVGTWQVEAGVTLADTAAGAQFHARLGDGTTTIAAGAASSAAANGLAHLALAGRITNPAANLRLSAKDASATTGKVKADATGSGNKDTWIRARRIA